MRVRVATLSIYLHLFLRHQLLLSVWLSFLSLLMIAACAIEAELKYFLCAFLFIFCGLAGSLAHRNILSIYLPLGRVDGTVAVAGAETVRSGRESDSRAPPHNVRMQIFSTAHDPHSNSSSNSILQSPALLPGIGLLLVIFLIAFFFPRLLGCMRAVDKKKKVAHIVWQCVRFSKWRTSSDSVCALA
jgi:hypothetical protein